MKTAVEWLALYIKGITSLNCDEVIEQAKEMEKEQIKNAYYTGGDDVEDNRDREAEQYYNETFKQQEL
jgi:vacuolar-type H+-ATPase subunit H